MTPDDPRGAAPAAPGAARVPPFIGAVHGVDINHDDDIDWPVLYAAGSRFAFIKAREGVTFADPDLRENFEAARAAGFCCGGYHFFRPLADVARQVDAFLADLRAIGGLQLQPVLDLEWCGKDVTGDGTGDDWTRLTLHERRQVISQALNHVKFATGRRPLIYCGRSWVDEQLGGWIPPEGIARLWVADYRPYPPAMPAPFSQWEFWQYGEERIAGCDHAVDVNWYAGTEASLRQILRPLA